MATSSGKDGVESRDGHIKDTAPFTSRILKMMEKYFTAASRTSASRYRSTRIEEMMKKRGVSRSLIEFEIESSRVHHSEVEESDASSEEINEKNREYWEVLKRRAYVREGGRIVARECNSGENWRRGRLFFGGIWEEAIVDGGSLAVHGKLAEGGQADIYAATWHEPDLRITDHMVVKVFREGFFLQDLEKQWPLPLMHHHQVGPRFESDFPSPLLGALLLRGEQVQDPGLVGRFAFVMHRYWGDLRKLTDWQMMHRVRNEGPPFSWRHVIRLIYDIALQMEKLHMHSPPILHRDLKAANVLVQVHDAYENQTWTVIKKYDICVADYECSLGVVGTGFWRAPEILQQWEDRVPGAEMIFTKESDVYSFGMTCYELVAGRIPFEGYSHVQGCPLVLKGKRPKLPKDLDPLVREIITNCWHAKPGQRPSFEDIVRQLTAEFGSLSDRSRRHLTDPRLLYF